MLAQNLSGNKRSSDRFTVVTSGFVTPAGTSGSERAVIDMTTLGAKPGDYMFAVCVLGNTSGGNGTVDQHTGASFAYELFAWSNGADGFVTHVTLDANHLLATALRILCRSPYRLYYCVVRSRDGSRTIGTLKQTSATPQDASIGLTFTGYSKSPVSKGHVMHVVDRDPTTTWVPPLGHTGINIALGSALDSVFARGTALLTDPVDYSSLSALTWGTLGAQTFGQAGVLIELT